MVRSTLPAPKPSSRRPFASSGTSSTAPEWVAETDRQLRVITRLVQPTESIDVIEADPTDDRILECAVAAETEVIVSGDTHLLSLGSFRGIPIQRVAEFLDGLQDQGRD